MPVWQLSENILFVWFKTSVEKRKNVTIVTDNEIKQKCEESSPSSNLVSSYYANNSFMMWYFQLAPGFKMTLGCFLLFISQDFSVLILCSSG